MQNSEISSVGELVSQIRNVRQEKQKVPWFRGQANEGWGLMPGLLRSKAGVSEATLITRFKQSAAMLADHVPTDSFGWIFLMQHYGVPTRLLDWSENPLVAAYFAVENLEEHPDQDAALWMLFPSELNKHANIVDKFEQEYVPSFDDEELQGYSAESLRNQRVELNPIATIATRNNARIQAQLGTFTIHHNKSVPIEKVGDGEHAIKLVIPKEARGPLLEELKLLGVNRFSLFPELSSVGQVLKEMVQ